MRFRSSLDDLQKEYETEKNKVKNNDNTGILDKFEIIDQEAVRQYSIDYSKIQDIYGDGKSRSKVKEATNKMKKLYAALEKYDKQLEKFKNEYLLLKDEVHDNENGVLDKLKQDDPKYNEYLKAFNKIESLYNKGENLYAVQKAIRKMQELKGVISNHKVGMKGVGDLAGDAQNKVEDQDLLSKIKNKKKLDKEGLKLIEEEVKKYVKSKVGNFEYFKSKIAEFSNKYKGENEYIPIEDMREIYGTKGALMMICNLENGKIIKRKFFSTYRRVCERILKNYRSLKVEAALTAVENASLNNKFDIKDVNEINTMLCKLGILKQEILLKQDWKLRFLQNMPYLKSKFGIDPDAKVFSFGEYMAKAEELIPRLKSVEGKSNRERKEMINRVIKKIRKVKSDGTEAVEEIFKREEYLKKYNDFIENSSNLALHYLKKEGSRKITRFNIKDTGGTVVEIASKRDYGIDTCKIALMCLVAVCSKNKAKISEGNTWFGMNEPFLKKCIG